jgi:prohibitin 1
MTIFDPPRGNVINVQGSGILRLLGLGFIGFLAVILLFSAVTRVDSGNVGVLTLFGKVTPDVLEAGIHLINPLKATHELSVRTQELKETW